ncbi:protein of unknown function [Xenorhabdus doucetiae]|uniref:Uncharacterized protein n=1 Tax=Xenorhabdus doucetiae TaxID=351671 RepID=A0A068QPT4_9GAMM|nr:protein of unknown function [Xenorhabdus doucetiae]
MSGVRQYDAKTARKNLAVLGLRSLSGLQGNAECQGSDAIAQGQAGKSESVKI